VPSTEPRADEFRISSGTCPIPLELPASLKSQQRVFEAIYITLSPKNHVPNNDWLRKSRDAAPPRAP
jgi:hypothetical protein